MINFLSCDWGTTSFRLRLIEQERVVAEIKEAYGIKTILNKAAGGDRAKLFAEFLGAKLTEIQHPAQGLPLVISGMASSSIGWKEIPYARTPFPLDGSGLRFEKLEWEKPAWLGDAFLVSGLATDSDLMRGEETQILGIMAERRNLDCVLVLPGTHSKHVKIETGAVVDFRTFMTGELFEVLSMNSVLRATIDSQAPVLANAAFCEGVEMAKRRGLAGSLFSVRTRGVLGKISGAENRSFLSGLLIGAELAKIDEPALLAVSGSVAPLYAEAMRVLDASNWECVPPEEVDFSVVRGQAMIFK